MRECPGRFPVPLTARDISGGWRPLHFAVEERKGGVAFSDHERVLQVNASAITNIAVSQQMDAAFYSYQPGWFRRHLRRPKYFLLQYNAMVGEKKYSVATVF